MALTSFTRSNSSGVFRSTQTRSNSYGINDSSNPSDKIPSAIKDAKIDVSSGYSFPDDIPPIHFGMIETDWEGSIATRSFDSFSSIEKFASTVGGALQDIVGAFGGSVVESLQSGDPTDVITGLLRRGGNAFAGASQGRQRLTGKKVYRLPLPIPIAEQFEVQYDVNFQAPYEQFQGIGSALTGFIPNTFKTVTLSQPDYRRHKFTWTLPPRNYGESLKIQRILHHIKKGMHPSAAAGKWFLSFPKIYLPYFFPNPKFLMKLKPCVIENVEINYQGGQPVPSFYRPDEANENRPPETVQFTISFLELEYWLDSDFLTDSDGIATNDPFDTFNYYELATKTTYQASQE